MVAFNHFPEWNWLIASGSYLDEFNSEGKTTGRGLLLLTLLLIPVVVIMVWVECPALDRAAAGGRGRRGGAGGRRLLHEPDRSRGRMTRSAT